MKLAYYPDTDIDLSERPSVKSREISTGVVPDYDADGNLVGVGVDVDDASGKVRLEELTVSKLPALVQNIVP